MEYRIQKPAESFRDLVAWRRAHEVVLAVYRLTAMFPKEERYGLTAHLRKAASASPANIAERFTRRGKLRLRAVLLLYSGFYILYSDSPLMIH